jgi:hypothetical protein
VDTLHSFANLCNDANVFSELFNLLENAKIFVDCH